MPQPILILIIGIAAFFAIIPLYALPATLSLPRGRRPGIAPLTLDTAAEQLRSSGKRGAEITEMPPLFRVFAGWGSTAVNAHRWYVSGRDQ